MKSEIAAGIGVAGAAADEDAGGGAQRPVVRIDVVVALDIDSDIRAPGMIPVEGVVVAGNDDAVAGAGGVVARQQDATGGADQIDADRGTERRDIVDEGDTGGGGADECNTGYS